MDREEIKNKLKEIFDKVSSKKIELEIKEETQLGEDFYLDSLEWMEMLFEIESQFSVNIDPEEAMRLKSVKDVMDVIQQRMKQEN
jgi:acyl carrier protein